VLPAADVPAVVPAAAVPAVWFAGDRCAAAAIEAVKAALSTAKN